MLGKRARSHHGRDFKAGRRELEEGLLTVQQLQWPVKRPHEFASASASDDVQTEHVTTHIALDLTVNPVFLFFAGKTRVFGGLNTFK